MFLHRGGIGFHMDGRPHSVDGSSSESVVVSTWEPTDVSGCEPTGGWWRQTRGSGVVQMQSWSCLSSPLVRLRGSKSKPRGPLEAGSYEVVLHGYGCGCLSHCLHMVRYDQYEATLVGWLPVVWMSQVSAFLEIFSCLHR